MEKQIQSYCDTILWTSDSVAISMFSPLVGKNGEEFSTSMALKGFPVCNPN